MTRRPFAHGEESVVLYRQLEYFVAVARERHVARAAEACYVWQPALSASIAKLERELNVTLINRGTNYEGLTVEESSRRIRRGISPAARSRRRGPPPNPMSPPNVRSIARAVGCRTTFQRNE